MTFEGPKWENLMIFNGFLILSKKSPKMNLKFFPKFSQNFPKFFPKLCFFPKFFPNFSQKSLRLDADICDLFLAIALLILCIKC